MPEGAVGLELIWEPEPAVEAAQFDQMAVALENMQVPLAFAAVSAADDSARRFAAEGPGWAPWTDDYAIARGPGSILVRTGEMRSHATDPGSYIVNHDTLVFPFENLKEMAHQYGAVTNRGGIIPARPYVGLSPEGEDAVIEGFARWLDNVINSSGEISSMENIGVLETITRAGGTQVTVRRGAGGRFVKKS